MKKNTRTAIVFMLSIVLLTGCQTWGTVSPVREASRIPNFDHIAVIMLENKSYEEVIGSPLMPNFNRWVKDNALLTGYHGVMHPSLPNYLALIGGSTFLIRKNCIDCFINKTNLTDLLEQSGRTWKTYQEDMPRSCFVGDDVLYRQKHNPFIYFDSVRLDQKRCEEHIVPLTNMQADLESGEFPNFAMIGPNICNSGHDCELDQVDAWLGNIIGELTASPVFAENSLIVITFDEASNKQTGTCCGLIRTGGHVATLLISPLVQPGLKDKTGYTHYNLLKTILIAWGLPVLGMAGEPRVALIQKPWKTADQP